MLPRASESRASQHAVETFRFRQAFHEHAHVCCVCTAALKAICLLAGEKHGQGKTWNKATRAPQKVFTPHKRFLPHKEQAVSIRTRGGESRRSLRVSRPPKQEAPVPPVVDSAHRRRRA